MATQHNDISRVYRTRAQAKISYDRMSRYYDLFAGIFEKKYTNRALKRLNIKSGETVLEIGFGTGHSLVQIAERVGDQGKVYGIDLSTGMLEVSKKRLKKTGLMDRVKLNCWDALDMPYQDNQFDAVFMSFTLELFDTHEIPEVLCRIRRILKPDGRLGVVSMSKENGKSVMLKLYEWMHRKFPSHADCRPIYVQEVLERARFLVKSREKAKLFGLPLEIVVGNCNSK